MTNDDIIYLKDLFPIILSINKEVIPVQKAIIEILSSASKYVGQISDILKESLKYLFECLNIPLLRKNASEVLLDIMDDNQTYVTEDAIFRDLLICNF